MSNEIYQFEEYLAFPITDYSLIKHIFLIRFHVKQNITLTKLNITF